MAGYVELQITSSFSFLRGASNPDELAETAFDLGYGAFGITDRNTLAGVVRAHAVAKPNGMRLLVGCRLDLQDGPSLLAYPTDLEAYKRLSKLLTLGMRRAPKGDCELYRADVYAAAKGIKMIMVCPEQIDKGFEAFVKEYRQQFGRNLYIALTHYYRGNDIKRFAWLSRLANQYSAKIVATNDVHYHHPDRRELQDVLTCIREKCTIQEAGYRLFGNAERHLKTADEMKRLFAPYPEAIRNTVEIAKVCTFSLDELKYEYPDELTTEGRTPQEEMEHLVRMELTKRYGDNVPKKVHTAVEKEFDLIRQMNFASYFLTVYDVVRFARSRGILCQGRGSAANSAVCHYLGVTPLDPAKFDLLVERFISIERNEPPDIDIDFEHERREEVMQYVFEKYGRNRAAIVANVSTYLQRGAMRDIGKAMGLSLDIVEKLVSTVWRYSTEFPTPEMLEQMGFDPSDPHLFKTMTLMAQVLGFPRHLSQHSGGFVISRDDLSELCPIMNATMKDRTCVIWDKDDLDTLGFIKVDLLSLGILTAIRKAFDLIKQHYGEEWTLATLPQDDPRVYDMITLSDTIGVFQVESRAQMTMLPKVKPSGFYDLAVQIALVRPGPTQGGIVNPYVLRKQGKQQYKCPKGTEEILGRTMGVPVFQEQAMKLAVVCAGFTTEEANLMRKYMSKAKRMAENVTEWEAKLISGMLANGYKREFADEIFNCFLSFTSYGFPESHSVSFAHLVYASAWLKCHYHDAFTCGMLNSMPMGFYMPSQLERDARKAGVTVRPIDVNHSDWDCTLEERIGRYHALRLGMRNVNGVRESDIRQLVANRGDGYADIAAIRQRNNISKSTLECLAKADAFRSMGLDRREALWYIQGLGTSLLAIFGKQKEEGLTEAKVQLPLLSDAEHVVQDYHTTSLSLKGHPITFIRDRLDRFEVTRNADLRQAPRGRYVRVAGIVTHRQAPPTAKGVVFVTLEDDSGSFCNVIVPPQVKEKFRKEIMNGVVLSFSGILQEEDTVLHVIARTVDDITSWVKQITYHSQMDLPLLVPRADEVKHGRVGSNRTNDELIKSRDFK